MATPRAKTLAHRYLSGWCELAFHYRCEGSYAGAACCSCHRWAVPGTGGTTAASRGAGK